MSSSKKERLNTHLEKHTRMLESVNEGRIPEKHKDAPEVYKRYLEREISLTKRTLEKL
jgi:hypothetical protein